jgi:hypothetical protein
MISLNSLLRTINPRYGGLKAAWSVRLDQLPSLPQSREFQGQATQLSGLQLHYKRGVRNVNPPFLCQDLLYSMYSATMSIVVSRLLFTRLGPDHPGCASGDALTDTARVSPLWWNTVLCHPLGVIDAMRREPA